MCRVIAERGSWHLVCLCWVYCWPRLGALITIGVLRFCHVGETRGLIKLHARCLEMNLSIGAVFHLIRVQYIFTIDVFSLERADWTLMLCLYFRCVSWLRLGMLMDIEMLQY
jgi:hypothetical protein